MTAHSDPALDEMESLRRRIGELERANALLEARGERYRDLIENARDMIWTIDLDGAVTFLNSACETITGFTRQELSGKEIADLAGAQNLQAAREALTRNWVTEKSTHFEIRILARDGSPVELEISSAILERDGAPAGFLAIARDITDRKQTQSALRRSAQEFEYLFARHPQPMWVFDAETLRFLEVNYAALTKYGYSREEFLAMSATDLRPRDDVPRFINHVRAPLRGHSGNAGHWRHCAKDGSIINVEVLWHAVVFAGRKSILAVIQDLTERRLLEEQLHQSHKLEAVGRLAGGVAHDFNNLLTVITGYSQLLLNRIEVQHPMHAGLDQIRQSADKAAILTRQLLAFSRRQPMQPAVIDLNAVVTDMGKMLRRLIGEHIELVTTLCPDVGLVRADPSQIEEAIMNLALNAREAMPQGGTVTIETATMEFTVQGAAGHPAGPYVLVSVSDTGSGIDNETRSHLFEPFFTTKGQREGRGLGLSSVYGVIEQHGGFIRVSSEPGEGSRFDLCLPMLPQVGDAAAVAAGGRETILIVEDEAGVLKLIAETLRAFGYTVLESTDGGEALEIAKRDRPQVDLLLTDIVMPNMTGRSLADAWKILHPDVKVLFMSGELFTGLGEPLLQKPFSAATLAHKVREALDDSE